MIHMPIQNPNGMTDGMMEEMNNIPMQDIIAGPLNATVQAQANAARTTVDFLRNTCMDDYTRAPDWHAMGATDVLPPNRIFPQRVFNYLGTLPNTANPVTVLPTGHYPAGQVVRHDGKYWMAYKVAKGSLEPGTLDGNDCWREVDQKNIRTVDFRYDQKVMTPAGQSWDSHAISLPLMSMVPIPYLRVDTLEVDFNVKLTGTETSTRTTSDDLKVSGRFVKPAVSIRAGLTMKQNKGQSSTVNRSYDLAVKIKSSQAEMPPGVERLINLMDKLISEDIADIED